MFRAETFYSGDPLNGRPVLYREEFRCRTAQRGDHLQRGLYREETPYGGGPCTERRTLVQKALWTARRPFVTEVYLDRPSAQMEGPCSEILGTEEAPCGGKLYRWLHAERLLHREDAPSRKEAVCRGEWGSAPPLRENGSCSARKSCLALLLFFLKILLYFLSSKTMIIFLVRLQIFYFLI